MFRLTLTAGLVLASLMAGADEPDFPRLAGTNYGGPQNYDDREYQRELARLDAAILSLWVGWEDGRPMTFEQVVKNVKAINPSTRIFVYLAHNELQTPDTPNAKREMRTMLDSTKSWLYVSGGSGSLVKSTWGNDFYITNTSLYAPRDSAGRIWVDAFANWAVSRFYKPNPSLDGFFLDNVFWRPRVDGDWNRDGVIDSKDDPKVQTWFRQGLRRHFDTMRQLMPGKMQLGNIADWGQAPGKLPELDQQLDGGLLENIIGPSHAVETWGGWQEMMKRYRAAMAATRDPRIVIFNQWVGSTDYQGIRYGLTSCLMDDGYYSLSNWPGGSSMASYRDLPWYDEYDADLGQPIQSPPTKAWQSGVYRRDFEGGIALVNPKGNGTRTVTLEREFRRISGTQVPSINNGQLTKTVTLRDRDGIILLGTGAKRPHPPSNVTIH